MRRRTILRLGAAGVIGSSASLGSAAANRADPYEPLGKLELPKAKDVAIDGRTAYVATTDGFAVVDVSDPTAPSIRAERTGLMSDYEQGPLEQVWDLWIDGDRLAVVGPANPTGETPEEYLSGAVLYDISNPDDPALLDEHETEFAIHNTFFDDGAVYLSGNGQPGNPLVVLSTDGDELAEVARWSPLDHEEGLKDVSGRLRTLHDMYVQDGRAYLLYWDAGTWIIDVSDPADPSYVSHIAEYDPEELRSFGQEAAGLEAFTPPGNHHYAEVNDDNTVLMIGAEAWTYEGENGTVGGAGGVELWDVSDPESPEQLSTIEPPETADNTRGGGQFTTSHNANMTGGRLYTSWYYGGVKVHDVTDPADPVELAWWRDPEETSFWTAQAVPDGDFFVATSGDLGDSVGALFTFPDREGAQENPPSLLETDAADTAESGSDGSESDEDTGAEGTDDTEAEGTDDTGAGSDSDDKAGGDAEGTGGTDDESTGGADGEDAEADGENNVGASENESDDDVPGFGVGTATVGLGLGAWRLLRKRNGD